MAPRVVNFELRPLGRAVAAVGLISERFLNYECHLKRAIQRGPDVAYSRNMISVGSTLFPSVVSLEGSFA